MKTLRLVVDPSNLENAEAEEALGRAAEIVRAGGLVALPTETVYGLGANALDGAAVKRIFEAKQRPAWDPIIVHISSLKMLEGLVEEVPEAARRLMEAFWPGPLTLLLRRTRAVPDAVTAGRALVGVRMPAHAVALEVIRRAGVPVAAPSANMFGHTSPTTAQHVLDDLDGRIDAVVDAGATAHGVESTVLDCCQSPMAIYRPGAVTAEQIQAVAGAAEVLRSGGGLGRGVGGGDAAWRAFWAGFGCGGIYLGAMGCAGGDGTRALCGVKDAGCTGVHSNCLSHAAGGGDWGGNPGPAAKSRE